jgi:hypothetical protein
VGWNRCAVAAVVKATAGQLEQGKAMGIDKLNAAARAAGFAMAVSDEFVMQPSPQRNIVEARGTERALQAQNSTALVVRAPKSQSNWSTWGMGWSFWRTA